MVEAALIAQFAVNGLVLGSIIALSAIGLTLVYGILNLSNFSHGDLLTAGAYATLFFTAGLSLGTSSAFAAVVGVLVVAAVAADRLSTKRLQADERILGLVGGLALVGFAIGLNDGRAWPLWFRVGLPAAFAAATWLLARRVGGRRAALAGTAATAFAAAWVWSTPLVLGVALAAGAVALLAVAFEVALWRPLRESRMTLGSHVLLGGFVGWVFGRVVATSFGIDGWAHWVVLAVTMAAGAAASRFALGERPIARANLVTYMIASVGVAFAIRYALVLRFGTGIQSLPVPVRALDPILGFQIFEYQRVALVVSLCVLLLVHLLLRYTRFGKAVRALADNMDLARVTGIDVDRVVLKVWLLAGALTAIAGTLLALNVGTFGAELGWGFLLLMFAAVILGGIGSVYGSLIGAFAIGVTTELSVLLIDGRYKFAAAFVVLIVILLIRPQGIFGVKA